MGTWGNSSYVSDKMYYLSRNLLVAEATCPFRPSTNLSILCLNFRPGTQAPAVLYYKGLRCLLVSHRLFLVSLVRISWIRMCHDHAQGVT